MYATTSQTSWSFSKRLTLMLFFTPAVHCIPFNFVNRYRPFITGIAAFDNYPRETLIGTSILLAAIWAAQYGFLPLRDKGIANHISDLKQLEIAAKTSEQLFNGVPLSKRRGFYHSRHAKRPRHLSKWDRLLLKVVSWVEGLKLRRSSK